MNPTYKVSLILIFTMSLAFVIGYILPILGVVPYDTLSSKVPAGWVIISCVLGIAFVVLIFPFISKVVDPVKCTKQWIASNVLVVLVFWLILESCLYFADFQLTPTIQSIFQGAAVFGGITLILISPALIIYVWQCNKFITRPGTAKAKSAG